MNIAFVFGSCNIHLAECNMVYHSRASIIISVCNCLYAFVNGCSSPPQPLSLQKWWPFFLSFFFCLSACSAGIWGPFFEKIFLGGVGGGGGGGTCQLKILLPPVPPYWKNPSYALNTSAHTLKRILHFLFNWNPIWIKIVMGGGGGGGHSTLSQLVGGAAGGRGENPTLSQTARRTKNTPCHNIPY